MFSPPLNTWRQHFNVQRDEPARFVALTDAPVMINRFRNLDFIFSNPFGFSDRFSGEEGYFSGKGRVVEGHRTWDSNFIADVPGFKLIDHSARGQGASGILAPFLVEHHQRAYRGIPRGNLSSRSLAWAGRAHRDPFRRRIFVIVGARETAHAHRLAAGHDVRAAGEMVSPAFQSRKGTRPLSRSEALGIHLSGRRSGEDAGSRSRRRHTDRLQGSGSGDPSDLCPRMRQARSRGSV